MSISAVFPFDSEANYRGSGFQVSSGSVGMLGTEYPDVVFSQTFSDSVGFVFDPTLVEFDSGVARQIDQRPVNGAFAALFNEPGVFDANWGGGDLTATVSGVVSVGANGLGFTQGSPGMVIYDGNLNSTGLVQAGCVRFTVEVGYTGSPAGDIPFVLIAQGVASSNNTVLVTHKSDGQMNLTILTEASFIIEDVDLGVWAPVSGNSYEIEVNFDVTNGEIRLFVEGVQLGPTLTGVGLRTDSIFTIALGDIPWATQSAPESFVLRDVVLFNEVQHTADYAPGVALPNRDYSETLLELPLFVEAGAIASLQSLSVLADAAVGYVLDDQYWDGVAWVVSDGSYAQSSLIADVNANIGDFSPAGDTLSVKVAFPETNDQQGIDLLEVSYTASRFPLMAEVITPGLLMGGFVAALIAETVPANTEIRHAVRRDGIYFYWDGTAWVEVAQADLSKTSSSVFLDVDANLSSMLGGSTPNLIEWVILLFTDDVKTSPSVEQLDLEYEYLVSSPQEPTGNLFGYVRDLSGNPVEGAVVTVDRYGVNEYLEADGASICCKAVATTDSTGYFSVRVIWSSKYDGDGMYTIKYEGSGLYQSRRVPFLMPDVASVNVADLLEST